MTRRPPTVAELALIISAMEPGPERAHLESLYWVKAAEYHGVDRWGFTRADSYRREYEWLRRRAHRLAELRTLPALGAYRVEGRAA